MADYLTVPRLEQLKGPLTAEQEDLASQIIPPVCAQLRLKARYIGKDLDEMISADEDLAAAAESVTADIVKREIDSVSSKNEMLTQATQITESAMGYSQSFTLPNSGGGIFIKKSELARLGLMRQRYGGIEMYGGSGND